MGKLNELSITIGRDNKAEIVFDSLFSNFLEVEYEKPNEYIRKYILECFFATSRKK